MTTTAMDLPSPETTTGASSFAAKASLYALFAFLAEDNGLMRLVLCPETNMRIISLTPEENNVKMTMPNVATAMVSNFVASDHFRSFFIEH